MLRRHHRFFQSLQVIRDVLLVAVSFYLAHALRFSFPQLLPFEAVSPREETTAIGLMLLVLFPVVGWASGLYVSRRSRSVIAEVFDVFRVTAVAFLAVVTVTYFFRDVRYSRATLLLWGLANFGVVSAGRIASRILLRRLRAVGYNLRHVVVVGVGELAQQVIRTVQNQPQLGLRVIGVVGHDKDQARIGQHIGGVPILGTVSALSELLQRHQADQVLVALPIDKLGALKKVMAILSQETVDVRLIPDVYQFMTLCGSIEEFAGLPMINLQATPLYGWNLIAKRTFDLLAAAFGLLLVSPLLLTLAALVKLASPGAIFYRQERVGMDGRSFAMYKFRTMCIDAEAGGAQMTTPNDPRRTPIGAFLRRTSLDELPQLWNVLVGDMSLVGPRPERPCFIEDFKREIPRYALRHKIKAGMTGWAQINGMRGNTSIKKRIELDLYYIENWSFMLDLKILLRTVLGGFLSPNAY